MIDVEGQKQEAPKRAVHQSRAILLDSPEQSEGDVTTVQKRVRRPKGSNLKPFKEPMLRANVMAMCFRSSTSPSRSDFESVSLADSPFVSL
jgi:hypothetical protein